MPRALITNEPTGRGDHRRRGVKSQEKMCFIFPVRETGALGAPYLPLKTQTRKKRAHGVYPHSALEAKGIERAGTSAE
jgi:hypothetical protein